ncbi:hypothetical protein NDN01_12900 [Sphingomonas sp. QA11]|uniref:hypothetical protein n=1 Tax=Sphingomonas sp. QA11 TaxID=2950605 RepID=UPI002349152A|nr:hypothetical protein [Sphingomonas sp. QA11]WCM29720.1 hypothetical protein NDN01_12900 [Sphingomonas sp. QA11]
MTHLLLRLVRLNNYDTRAVAPIARKRPIARWVRAADGSLRCLWDDRRRAAGVSSPERRSTPVRESV